jgi:hypothetical protein
MIKSIPVHSTDHNESVFKLFLTSSAEKLERTIKQSMTWKQFEAETVNCLKQVQFENPSEPYADWNVNLVGGSRFPDIAIEFDRDKSFGLEVKTTQNDDWKTLGGSVMESTRIKGIDRIYLFFAHFAPTKLRWDRYDRCISDVTVTHSPRYVLDMNIADGNNLFDLIGVPYEVVSNSDSPFELLRSRLIQKSKSNNVLPWYIGENYGNSVPPEVAAAPTFVPTPAELPGINVTWWSDLPRDERDLYQSVSYALFPDLLKARSNYDKVALWLLKMGILNSSLRDVYSAGGNRKSRVMYFLPLTTAIFTEPMRQDLSQMYSTRNPLRALDCWYSKIQNFDLEQEILVEVVRAYETRRKQLLMHSK